MTKVLPSSGPGDWSAGKNWVSKNIKINVCSCFRAENPRKSLLKKPRFLSRGEGDEDEGKRCQCGYLQEEHDPAAINNGKRGVNQGELWNSYSDTDKQPTDAYGNIIFPNLSPATKPPIAKYVRMSPETPYKDIVSLFKDCWEVPPPVMILSLIGNDHEIPLPEKSQYTIRRAIVRIAVKTKSWLVTQGWDKGVGRMIGQGYAEFYSDRINDPKVPLVGVPTWGCLSNAASLVNATEENVDAVFPIGGDTNINLKQLEANHGFFLLSDNGTFMKPDQDFELRLKMIDAISKFSPKREKWQKEAFKTRNAPVVNIVFGGNFSAFRAVVYAVGYNMPCMMVKGTGGAADFIHEFVKKLPGKRIDFEDEVERAQLLERILSQSSGNAFVRTLKASLQPDDWTVFKEGVLDIAQSRTLIQSVEIGPSGNAKDVENQILDNVMKTKMSAANRVDMALQLNKDATSPALVEAFQQLEQAECLDLMQKAVVKDRPKFVRNFLQVGVSLGKFLDMNRLVRLYRATDPNSIFGVLFKKEVGKDVSLLDLPDISRFLKRMLTSAYKLEYAGGKRVEGAERHLFIYSLLTVKPRSLDYFWEESSGGSGSALLAARYLRAVAEHDLIDDDPTEQKMLRNLADQYEQKAVDVIQVCNADNEIRTLKLITYNQTKWANEDLLSVADASESKKFIACREVQDVLEWKWLGRMSPQNSKLFIYLAMLCPLLIFFIKYDTDPEASEKSQDKKNQDKTPEEQGALKPKRKRVPFYKKPLQFYRTPLVKMFSYYTSYSIFLLAFAYVMLHEFKSNDLTFHPFHFSLEENFVELLVHIYVLTLIIEEIRQMVTSSNDPILKNLGTYFSSFWNWIDVYGMLCFIPAMVIRWFFFKGSNPDLGLDSEDWFTVSRSLFILSLMFFILRMIHCLSLSESIGPKILMLGKMVGDLMFFIVALAIFMLSFGIGLNLFLYPEMAYGEDNKDFNNWPKVVRSVFDHTYWPAFGEVYEVAGELDMPSKCDDLTNPYGECQTGEVYRTIGKIIYIFYVFLTNFLLVNLLIAMMVYSFNKEAADADMEYKYERFQFQKEFYNKPAIPNPFSFIVIIYRLVAWCINKAIGPSDVIPEAIYAWERQNKRDKLLQIKRGSSDLPERVSQLESRVDYLISRIEGGERRITVSVNDQLAILQRNQADMALLLAAMVPASTANRDRRYRKAIQRALMGGADSSDSEREADTSGIYMSEKEGSVKAESIRAEPVRRESFRAEPVRRESFRAEPVRRESLRAEPPVRRMSTKGTSVTGRPVSAESRESRSRDRERPAERRSSRSRSRDQSRERRRARSPSQVSSESTDTEVVSEAPSKPPSRRQRRTQPAEREADAVDAPREPIPVSAAGNILTATIDESGRTVLVPVDLEELRKEYNPPVYVDPPKKDTRDDWTMSDTEGEYASEAESRISAQDEMLRELLEKQGETNEEMRRNMEEAERKLQALTGQIERGKETKQELDDRLKALDSKLERTLTTLEQSMKDKDEKEEKERRERERHERDSYQNRRYEPRYEDEQPRTSTADRHSVNSRDSRRPERREVAIEMQGRTADEVDRLEVSND